jgi:hypothetical protein
MNELDEAWSKMLAEAAARARASGRHDVAEYLTLKAANDAIREGSARWLFDSLIEIAAECRNVLIEKQEPHNFEFRGSNMVGSMLRVRQGVRSMTVEAGWTRTPKDGFMRGGALANAKITHFGLAKENVELLLVKENGRPHWVISGKTGPEAELVLDDLKRHLLIMIGK